DGGPVQPVMRCNGVGAGTVAATATPDLQYLACPVGAELLDVLGPTGPVRFEVALDQWAGLSSDGRRGLVLRDRRLEVRDLATGGVVASMMAGDVRATVASGELCAYSTSAQVVIWNTASGATAEVALPRVDHLAIAGSWIFAAAEHEVVLL